MGSGAEVRGNRVLSVRWRSLLCVVATLLAVGRVELDAQPVTEAEYLSEYPEIAAMVAELTPVRSGRSDTPHVRDRYRTLLPPGVGATHDTWRIDSDGTRIVVHVLLPLAPRATIIVVHGYLSHPIQTGPFTREALQRGYAVILPELHGHALSGGVRGAIDDFAAYGAMIGDVVAATAEVRPPGPLHIVAHSTGGSAVYEFLQQSPDPFDAVVLVAPLVYPRAYGTARVVWGALEWAMEAAPSLYEDPLGIPSVPREWFEALVAWNRRRLNDPAITRPLLVVQGTADMTVAWRRNLRELPEMFTNLTTAMVEGGEHVLLAATGSVGESVRGTVFTWIESEDER